MEAPKQTNPIIEKYRASVDQNGFVMLGAINRADFGGRQVKSIAALLDGEEGTSPELNLGEGLRYEGASGNYSDMKIHIDDLPEFLNRIANHYT